MRHTANSPPIRWCPDLPQPQVEAIRASRRSCSLDDGFIKKDFDLEKFIVRGPLEQAQGIVLVIALKYQPERAQRPASGGSAVSHA